MWSNEKTKNVSKHIILFIYKDYDDVDENSIAATGISVTHEKGRAYSLNSRRIIII